MLSGLIFAGDGSISSIMVWKFVTRTLTMAAQPESEAAAALHCLLYKMGWPWLQSQGLCLFNTPCVCLYIFRCIYQSNLMFKLLWFAVVEYNRKEIETEEMFVSGSNDRFLRGAVWTGDCALYISIQMSYISPACDLTLSVLIWL